jgi:hypothetical protein
LLEFLAILGQDVELIYSLRLGISMGLLELLKLRGHLGCAVDYLQ